jgi:hypothetical protein
MNSDANQVCFYSKVIFHLYYTGKFVPRCEFPVVKSEHCLKDFLCSLHLEDLGAMCSQWCISRLQQWLLSHSCCIHENFSTVNSLVCIKARLLAKGLATLPALMGLNLLC